MRPMQIPSTWRAVSDAEQQAAIAAANATPSPPGCIDRFHWLGGVCAFGHEGSFLRPGDNIVNIVFVMPNGSLQATADKDNDQ